MSVALDDHGEMSADARHGQKQPALRGGFELRLTIRRMRARVAGFRPIRLCRHLGEAQYSAAIVRVGNPVSEMARCSLSERTQTAQRRRESF